MLSLLIDKLPCRSMSYYLLLYIVPDHFLTLWSEDLSNISFIDNIIIRGILNVKKKLALNDIEC